MGWCGRPYSIDAAPHAFLEIQQGPHMLSLHLQAFPPMPCATLFGNNSCCSYLPGIPSHTHAQGSKGMLAAPPTSPKGATAPTNDAKPSTGDPPAPTIGGGTTLPKDDAVAP
eukprot:scaffold190330_cov18-Tisochrysis_lutea.AAC.1